MGLSMKERSFSQCLRLLCFSLMMASPSMIAKVSWCSGLNRTGLTLVIRAKSLSWTPMAAVYSLSEERGRVCIKGGKGIQVKGTDGNKPIFSVRRSSIIGRCSVTVEVYGSPGAEYQIEGSFANRSCTIFNAAKESMAEIRRKVDASTNVVLGKDVFSLCLKPGFDGAFAMGLVLILDQITGDDAVPTTED
ncbi:hypothetical protein OIU78_010552 [Salix suchowensis]|nr:hypothetical protein OIU78_010552 [Salix suchowensis]